jgi:hypothetical protein
MRTIQEVMNRLRAEYLEMPGLLLTPSQVERLCGIERTICRLVLDELVNEKFLCTKSDGRYARLTEGTDRRQQPATPHLALERRVHKAS